MFGKMPPYYEFYQVMIHSPFLSAVTHQENQWYRLSTNKLRQVTGTQKCPLSPTMEITSSGRIIIDANDDDRRVEGTGDWCGHKGFDHKKPPSAKGNTGPCGGDSWCQSVKLGGIRPPSLLTPASEFRVPKTFVRVDDIFEGCREFTEISYIHSYGLLQQKDSD